MSTAYTAPGRIGNASKQLSNDPRTNPHLLKALQELKADHPDPMPFPGESTDIIRPIMAQFDKGFSALFDAINMSTTGDDQEPEVIRSTRFFKSFDGVERKLYITRRLDQKDEVLPAVVYIHGGGMVILSTTSQVMTRWTKSIALQGVAVIAVDFRNAYTDEKDYLFPTGLNDCAAAVQYIHAHKAELGISKLVLQGESGGANLCLATALKANQEGFVNQIDGVFGVVPYISGAHRWSEERKLKELPSLVECNAYFMEGSIMAIQSAYYSPGNYENPLAWPYYATETDVQGLPPHMLVMDELDPLRDEGVAYHRKLVNAGVSSVGLVSLGAVHGTSSIFRHAVPDFHNSSVREIAAFAKSV